METTRTFSSAAPAGAIHALYIVLELSCSLWVVAVQGRARARPALHRTNPHVPGRRRAPSGGATYLAFQCKIAARGAGASERDMGVDPPFLTFGVRE
jgi:hypothetical protein